MISQLDNTISDEMGLGDDRKVLATFSTVVDDDDDTPDCTTIERSLVGDVGAADRVSDHQRTDLLMSTLHSKDRGAAARTSLFQSWIAWQVRKSRPDVSTTTRGIMKMTS